MKLKQKMPSEFSPGDVVICGTCDGTLVSVIAGRTVLTRSLLVLKSWTLTNVIAATVLTIPRFSDGVLTFKTVEHGTLAFALDEDVTAEFCVI